MWMTFPQGREGIYLQAPFIHFWALWPKPPGNSWCLMAKSTRKYADAFCTTCCRMGQGQGWDHWTHTRYLVKAGTSCLHSSSSLKGLLMCFSRNNYRWKAIWLIYGRWTHCILPKTRNTSTKKKKSLCWFCCWFMFCFLNDNVFLCILDCLMHSNKSFCGWDNTKIAKLLSWINWQLWLIPARQRGPSGKQWSSSTLLELQPNFQH